MERGLGKIYNTKYTPSSFNLVTSSCSQSIHYVDRRVTIESWDVGSCERLARTNRPNTPTQFILSFNVTVYISNTTWIQTHDLMHPICRIYILQDTFWTMCKLLVYTQFILCFVYFILYIVQCVHFLDIFFRMRTLLGNIPLCAMIGYIVECKQCKNTTDKRPHDL